MCVLLTLVSFKCLEYGLVPGKLDPSRASVTLSVSGILAFIKDGKPIFRVARQAEVGEPSWSRPWFHDSARVLVPPLSPPPPSQIATFFKRCRKQVLVVAK